MDGLAPRRVGDELEDISNFIQFGLNHWTLEWYNGIDFTPDFLYRQGKEMALATSDADYIK